MALLEAQASGLAAIAGASGGVGDIVSHGVTGLLTPPGDAGAFADALRDLMADPPRCAVMGEAARDKIRRAHDLPAAARSLADILASPTRARAA
jgi:glycosyltransferase involved in cell wall biosynthesis